MPELVLHHYDLSPFCEKIRLAFGLKGLSWRAVEIPIWPPRPDTVPLTAGYRRAPVLQIGADIYCDTILILSELERRFPEPTLYPQGARALSQILSWWADTTTFLPAAKLTTSIIGDGVPSEFITDRIAFMGEDFSRAASQRELAVNRQRVTAQMNALSAMLGDGRRFILGDEPSSADLSAYHTLWFARANGGEAAEAMMPLTDAIRSWMGRIEAFGHGTRGEMTSAEALDIARAAEPEPAGGVDANDPSGLAAGTAVLVRADSANDPIRGTLVGADDREIVIRHENERVGTVHAHFPRFGYSAVADEQGGTGRRAA